MADNSQLELELAWNGRLNDLITDLSHAPTGNSWAASSAAGEVAWNAGLTELAILKQADGQSIDRVRFSADGRWLAAGGQAGKLFVWNCEDPQIPPQAAQTIDIGTWIEHLVWHPSQSTLAVASGKHVRIWTSLTETATIVWQFDRSSVFDLAWHPDSLKLAVAGYKGVQIWTPQALTAPPQSINADTASINIAWAGDGRYLAAGNLDRTLTISDTHHPEESWTLTGCPGKIRQLAWLVGTETPCLAAASGIAIGLWHLSADATTWDGRLLEGHQGIISSLVAHPQTPKLASGGADGYTCIWTDLGEIEQILDRSGISEFTSLSWYPNRPYLGTGDRMGELCIWQIPA